MKDILIIFIIMLVLLLLISALGGTMRFEKFDLTGAPVYLPPQITLEEANHMTERFIDSKNTSLASMAGLSNDLVNKYKFGSQHGKVTAEEAIVANGNKGNNTHQFSTIEPFDGNTDIYQTITSVAHNIKNKFINSFSS